MELQFNFERPINFGTPGLDPPVIGRETPRLRQSFFRWYEPEDRPPSDDAPPADSPPVNRSAVVAGAWKQLHFRWYDD